jgi:hypothetical protein
MKKVLVSGCSFTRSLWPQTVFDPAKYKLRNVAKESAGNSYISNSITAEVNWRPDFVFVLWSGINRLELRTPNNTLFEKHLIPRATVVQNSIFWPTGIAQDLEKSWIASYNNMRDTNWPDVTTMQEWFTLPDAIKQECLENHNIRLATNNYVDFINHYYVTQYLQYDELYYSELTFQNMMNCFNLLDRLNIPYRFSSIYDMFSKNHIPTLGQAQKEHYYNLIDWSKYIDLTPYEYGIKNNLLHKDNFHLTDKGYTQWGKEIAKILKTQQDLKHLFE